MHVVVVVSAVWLMIWAALVIEARIASANVRYCT